MKHYLIFLTFQINEHVTQKPSSVVKTEDVFPSFGCVISTTIVVMIQMNQLTCVVREIAQLDGSDVPVNLTIDAFQNGSSVMVKTIAVITVTSFPRIAQYVNQKQTSNVKIIAAFPNNGPAILLTIAATVPMNPKHNAKENIENVLNQSFTVTTENAFQADGDVVSRRLCSLII